MMINKRTLSLLGFVSMTVVFLNPLGKPALAGGFSRSCGAFKLTGTILNARCTNRSGNLRTASLDLNRGISNRDGHLRKGGSGYGSTCKNMRLDKTTLRGQCLTTNRDLRNTSLNLDSFISNKDGTLTFDR